VVPVFHHARVYTAYEYLEKRFDSKTRVLGSVIFLCQRGLSAGLTIYAPALVLSVILGWPEHYTTIMMALPWSPTRCSVASRPSPGATCNRWRSSSPAW